jgi:hypothetical protein
LVGEHEGVHDIDEVVVGENVGVYDAVCVGVTDSDGVNVGVVDIEEVCEDEQLEVMVLD